VSTPVGSHGLTCIDDDDYAAYALSMQCNAVAIDTALAGVNGQMGGYLNRGWITVVNRTAVTIDDSSGGGTIGPGGVIGEPMDTNGSGVGSPLVTRNVLPGPSSGGQNLMPRGIYLVGSSVNFTFGATTANSNRQIQIFGVRFLNGSQSAITNFTNLYQMRDYQGDGGASGALSVVGLVDGRAGNLANFQTFVSHANVASDMSVAVNNWRLWVTYLGSGLAF
jgi:hypothetical protein